MSEKRLYILRGLPGAGKSTLAQLLVAGCDGSSIVAEADQFFTDEEGNYRFEVGQLGKAHEWCQYKVETAMRAGIGTVIVANTFTRTWEGEPYAKLANTYGYSITVVTVEATVSLEELAARNVHGVGVDIIRKMNDRWEV